MFSVFLALRGVVCLSEFLKNKKISLNPRRDTASLVLAPVHRISTELSIACVVGNSVGILWAGLVHEYMLTICIPFFSFPGVFQCSFRSIRAYTRL